MRIALAFRAFFATLWGQPLPEALRLPPGAAEATSKGGTPEAPAPSEVPLAEAVAAQTLGLLQAEGRLLDFLAEDISGYEDAEVGQVVREVHRGLQKALNDHFDLEPVLPEDEESTVTVGASFNPHEIRLVGRLSGKPPMTGTLKHAGYRATAIRLPRIRTDGSGRIVAPAEVEV